MKQLMLIVSLTVLASCASNKTGHEPTDAVIAHMSKPKVVVGKDWEEKFTKSGLVNGEFVAIGLITKNINSHENSMKVTAEADATSKLLISAPTEFKKIVQRAIQTVNGDDGSTDQMHISVTEVKALTGLKSEFDDAQCVTTAVPNTDLKYDFVKECRVIVRVPASNLMKAYNYTLDKKYGIAQQSQIQEVLKQQLIEKVLDKPVPQVTQIQSKPEPIQPVAKAFAQE